MKVRKSPKAKQILKKEKSLASFVKEAIIGKKNGLLEDGHSFQTKEGHRYKVKEVTSKR